LSKINLYLITIFIFLPLFGCQRVNEDTNLVDRSSYISDFKLIQENPKTDIKIIIKSPMAVIKPLTNDLEILDSKILINSETGNNIKVISGKAILNNSQDLIKAYNGVKMSLLNNDKYFINTESFTWNLNKSKINMRSPLDINFGNTSIISSSGSYDTISSNLKLKNNIFNRSILNLEGKKKFYIEILSDNANWNQKNNIIEFTSNQKQVETTIQFLSTK
tara:strand:- start:278 stop:937 length:660 start_codon:yes stop_codon:yes gene_type:complete